MDSSLAMQRLQGFRTCRTLRSSSCSVTSPMASPRSDSFHFSMEGSQSLMQSYVDPFSMSMARSADVDNPSHRLLNTGSSSTMNYRMASLHGNEHRNSYQDIHSPTPMISSHRPSLGEISLSMNNVSEPPAKLTRGLIIKAYDDCRQDTLALQIMRLLETIWMSEGIDVPLKVYNVTPARTSDSNHAMGGLIECVRDSDSRDNLGKKGFTSLKQYYEVGAFVECRI